MAHTLTSFLETAGLNISNYDTFTEGTKNLHLTHAEDVVLYGGVKGIRNVINTLRDVRDTLGGQSSSKITTKFDGAPAIFFGFDPSDGEFFVAKKGVFNKNPKIYKTDADIEADLSGKGNLVDMFKIALRELPKLGISAKDGVVQGDVMFTKNSIKKETIDGQPHVTFHPNTLVYAVPTDTPLGKSIMAADFGLVIHTTYKGKSFETMSASFDVNRIKTKRTRTVWVQTADVENVSDSVSFTDTDYKTLTAAFSKAGKLFQKLSSSTLKKLEANLEMARLLEQYNNTLVRKGESIGNTRQHAKNFNAWLVNRADKEVASKKSEAGKKKASLRAQEMLEFFDSIEKDLPKLYDLQNALVEAKSLVIAKLNEISSLKKFVLKKDGYHATNDEGFVAINSTTGDAVKLVDRLTFSYQNFSSEILKQWMR